MHHIQGMTLAQFAKPVNPHYFSSLPEINNPAIYVREAGFQLAAFLPGSLLGVLKNPGVRVVAQWLTNPTRNHEVAGSVPALAQWVNDPVLP